MQYTEPIINGTRYTKLMPPGTALVLEGGGTRGFYSAGVFEAFMDFGVMFPYIIGVSAGAANAISYIAGQKGRNRVIVEKYVGSHRYVSRRNLIRHRTLFGYDFIFETVPKKHVFFDRRMFDEADVRFLTGAFDCESGRTVWFEKDDITDGFMVTRASCSVPILAKIVNHSGLKLLDGGIGDPIPIEKSVADGNSFHVVVLTQNKGFVKEPVKFSAVLRMFYKKFPKLVETMHRRHEIYNRQLELCERLENDGKALIIRPLEPLTIGRTERDAKKLLSLYDEGHKEGALAMNSPQIAALLDKRPTEKICQTSIHVSCRVQP